MCRLFFQNFLNTNDSKHFKQPPKKVWIGRRQRWHRKIDWIKSLNIIRFECDWSDFACCGKYLQAAKHQVYKATLLYLMWLSEDLICRSVRLERACSNESSTLCAVHFSIWVGYISRTIISQSSCLCNSHLQMNLSKIEEIQCVFVSEYKISSM